MKLTFTKFKTYIIPAGVLICAGGYLLGMIFMGAIALASKNMPSAETLWRPNRPVSVQIVDRYGRDVLVRGAVSYTHLTLPTILLV